MGIQGRCSSKEKTLRRGDGTTVLSREICPALDIFVSHISAIAKQNLIEKSNLGVALTRLYWVAWDETGGAYFWIASVFGVIGLCCRRISAPGLKHAIAKHSKQDDCGAISVIVYNFRPS